MLVAQHLLGLKTLEQTAPNKSAQDTRAWQETARESHVAASGLPFSFVTYHQAH